MVDIKELKVRADKLMANPSSTNVIKVVQEIVCVLEELIYGQPKEKEVEEVSVEESIRTPVRKRRG